MTELVGLNNDLALFRVGEHGIVLNTSTLDVFDAVPFGEIAVERYSKPDDLIETPVLWTELANAAACSLDVESVVAGGERTYAVPKNVQYEAKRALSWQAKHGRGGDEISLSVAHRLASGDPVDLETVQHCAKYFPGNAGTEFGMGWSAHQEGFPSEHRVTFGLWGGDPGKRWSQRITKAEAAAKGMTAASDLPDVTQEPIDPYSPHKFVDSGDGSDLCDVCSLPAEDPIHQASTNETDTESTFADSTESDDVNPQEVDPDEPHVYAPGENGTCKICGEAVDDIMHVSMGSVSAPGPVSLSAAGIYDPYEDEDSLADFYSDFVIPDEFEVEDEEDLTYLVSVDSADDPKDLMAEDMYVTMPDGAVLTWRFGMWEPAELPADKELIELDEESAWEVGKSFYKYPDKAFLLAALNPGESAMFTMAANEIDWTTIDRITQLADNDGQYTPEERSANATKQVRDRNGRFAKAGTAIKTADGSKGRITKVDAATKSVEVEFPDGSKQNLLAKDVTVDPQGGPGVPPPDLSGVEAKPRATTGTPKAWLPTLLPVLDAAELAKVIADYWARVQSQRSAANAAAAQGEALTPETSDVPPLYLAFVDTIDKQAVTELVALIPATVTTTEPVVFRRDPNAWVQDDDLLASLQSVSPPPVVVLDDATLAMVMEQVDGESPQEPASETAPAPEAAPATAPTEPAPVQASALPLMYGEYGEILPVVAAGGLDRNRGGAEKLRRYWTVGPGGAKIRWNTPGDWKRCVRQLSKHLGPRARGYCALRHKEMTGMWTGDKEHLDMYGLSEITHIPSLDAVLIASAAAVAGEGVDLEDPEQVPQEAGGVTEERATATFSIPLVLPEDLESGDGRSFEPGSLTTRDMPIPLMWQIQGEEGHNGSVIVGRVDQVERIENGLGNARGVFDSGPYGQEALRLVREGMLRGISADLDQFEASTVAKVETDENSETAGKSIGGDKLRIKAARLMGITLVAKPAFQECQIVLDGDQVTSSDQVDENEMEPVVADGMYIAAPAAEEAGALVAAALVAGSVPLNPPREWFTNPQLTKPTAIEVTEDGRVFGHIAAWDVDHIGLPFSTKPPRSRSNYAYFHTGVLRTAEGKDVPVGQLTLAGGHAPLEASAQDAVKHYDDTASAIADVHAGEDAFGIWVAGAMRPGVSPEQVRVLRASAPSGDWRPIGGALELVAVCQVNVPGFPITRSMVAGGKITALVAAGCAVLAEQRRNPLEERLNKLEQISLTASLEALRERVQPARQERQLTLQQQAEAIKNRVNDRLEARQALMASAEQARRRVQPVQEARRQALLAAAQEQAARVASLRYKQKFEEERHPRDDQGRFKEVLFRLEQRLQDDPAIPGAQEALDKIHDAQAAENEDHKDEAKEAASDAVLILDRAAEDIVDPDARSTISNVSEELARAIAYIPLPFDDQTQTMRWSDVPPAGQAVIENLLMRARETDDPETSVEIVEIIEGWMAGGDMITQSEFDAMVAKLVRSIL